MTKVSVVIPTRNEEKVFDAIRSVQDQNYKDYEIIVVDGSDGAHQESLEQFCKDKEVKYLRESDFDRPSCLNAARNIGVEKAEGNIIALLDGDCQAEGDWLINLLDYFENHDIVESNVKYVSEGKNCPMDRAVENSGRNYGFLGAGLSFKKGLWRRLGGFDEDFTNFRDDTEFGLRAVEAGYSYTYGQEAKVNHHAGKFTPIQFVKERMRFQDEPLFFSKFRDHPRLENEISRFGRILEPKELAVTGAITLSLLGAIITPYSLLLTPLFMAGPFAIYLKRESGKRDLDFCPKDLLLLFFLVPLTFVFVKRYAIWKGAIKHRILVL